MPVGTVATVAPLPLTVGGMVEAGRGKRDAANLSERWERHGGRLWRVWRVTCRRHGGEPVALSDGERLRQTVATVAPVAVTVRTCRKIGTPEPLTVAPSEDRHGVTVGMGAASVNQKSSVN